MKFGSQVAYKQSTPLYRGIKHTTVDLKMYQRNKLSYWPGFTSTSKDRNVAIERSRDQNP